MSNTSDANDKKQQEAEKLVDFIVASDALDGVVTPPEEKAELIALAGGFLIYGMLKLLMGIRLSQEEEFNGADLSIHRISANSEENMF